jgi:antirestriction protein ArdC
MPLRKAFSEAEGFYETMFHEMGHSTGHASRLNRKEITGGIYFGSQDYSLEELVAELTAAFLCAEAGIDQPVLNNTVAYLRSWLEKLQKEPQAFITAAARAQKAADYILDRKAVEKPEEAA